MRAGWDAELGCWTLAAFGVIALYVAYWPEAAGPGVVAEMVAMWWMAAAALVATWRVAGALIRGVLWLWRRQRGAMRAGAGVRGALWRS